MTTTTTLPRIQLAREILEAMAFLGLPADSYLALKAAHGGQAGLHAFLTAEICG